ncbi:MAG: 50S ribosomal protein L2 [DPANN group archaeon]|nr:50S ribosomal protein L2 [DPANN group archaeon]
MGKRLAQQARGAGGPRYLAPSHRYFGKISYPKANDKIMRGEIIDIVDSVGHTEPLMVVKYENGDEALLPAPIGIKVGQVVFSGENAPLQPGAIMQLKNVPAGTPVCCIEKIPQNGPEFVRTSGGFALIVSKGSDFVEVKMPSKRMVKISSACRVMIGVIAGGGRTEKPWVKGGKKAIAMAARNKRFPLVSGVAQNSIDHKFGGSHRRSLGVHTSTKRGTPPGRKVGLLWPRRTGKR